MIFNKMMTALIGLSILSAPISNATATYSVPQSTNGTFSEANGTANHDSKPASHDAMANPVVPQATNSTPNPHSKPAPTPDQQSAVLDSLHFFDLLPNATLQDVMIKNSQLAQQAQNRLREINKHYKILKDYYSKYGN